MNLACWELIPHLFRVEQQHKLSLNSGSPLSNPGIYRWLVGHLIYLTIIGPELSYSVHILSQFMHDPRQGRWDAAMRVLWNLKQSFKQRILLRPSSLTLMAYCYSDWASCPFTHRSVTSYFITLGGSSISWQTKKQTTVSWSSAKAEYRAMAATTSEILWLQHLLRSLSIDIHAPTLLFCDNQAYLHITAN